MLWFTRFSRVTYMTLVSILAEDYFQSKKRNEEKNQKRRTVSLRQYFLLK